MRKLSGQDIIDIIYGCAILGTGGGGSLEGGLEIVQKDIDAGRVFMLADLSEIPDDALIACPYAVGAVSPEGEEEELQYKGLDELEDTEALQSFRALEAHMGEKFYGVITTELGGENTADAFSVAARMGRVIVDADPTGRSVPEMQHSTFFINDVSISPFGIATRFGDTAVFDNVANDFRSESLVRAMAGVSKNLVGVTSHPMRGAELKKCVIPKAISQSLVIGTTLREAKEKGLDVAEEIVKVGNGKILFRGVVDKYTWDTINSFTIGDVELSGIKDYEGSTYKVWYKNEHIISWRDGEFDVTVPDLICMVDKNGDPVTNPSYSEGMEITVFALPAPEEWKVPKGIEVFGPRSFGFDVDYVPFV